MGGSAGPTARRRGRGLARAEQSCVTWAGGEGEKGVRLSLVHPLFHAKLDDTKDMLGLSFLMRALSEKGVSLA